MFRISIQLICSAVTNPVYHTDQGTEYGEFAANAYAESNHGPDGSFFLDPYFKPEIERLENKKVLDAGCGSAPWSIYAAQNGGEIYAIDIQDKMIELAQQSVEAANLKSKIKLSKGDVAALPYEEEFFDKALSICVACNLPPEGFEKHLFELKRTLKNAGTAVIAAPNSLHIVFSDGSKNNKEVLKHINEVLNTLPNNPSASVISDRLLELREVLSATFYIKEGKLSLLTEKNGIPEGSEIWRKLPKLVVPNRFYSIDYYQKHLAKAGLEITKTDLPKFKNSKEWEIYNNKVAIGMKLGDEYVHSSPFAIFHIKNQKLSNCKNKPKSEFRKLIGSKNESEIIEKACVEKNHKKDLRKKL